MADNEPTVAGYRKVRVLRRDALGDVYQATHEKANISVCLRVLASPEDMDADTWGELRYRLVGTLLQLQQVGAIPGIEMVQGVGEVFNAIWVVTEFVDGMTLEDKRQTSGPTPYSEALPLLKTVAESLDEIHGRGICHGWLNADHVLLTTDGEVRLLGVGLGMMPGCYAPKYAAPERGEEGPTRAADIYAFGVLVRKVLGGEQITLPVRAVLDRLSHDDPAHRYRRATEAIADLEEGRLPVPVAGAVRAEITSPADTPPPPALIKPPSPLPIPAATAQIASPTYEPVPAAVSVGSVRTNGVVPPAAFSHPPANATTAPPSPAKGGMAPGRPAANAVMPTTARKQAEVVWMVVALVAFIVAVGGLWFLLNLLKGSNTNGETPKPSQSARPIPTTKPKKKP